MLALTDLVLEQHAHAPAGRRAGRSRTTWASTPRLMFLLDHAVKKGDDPDQVLSRRCSSSRIDPHGNASIRGLGAAPRPGAHRPGRPAPGEGRACRRPGSPRPGAGRPRPCLDQLVPEHFEEVRTRRERPRGQDPGRRPRTPDQGDQLLVRPLDQVQGGLAAGKDVRLKLDNVRRTIDDLDGRLPDPQAGTAGDAPRRSRPRR